MKLHLYIDSDGTAESTHVYVLGEDGACLGELTGLCSIEWKLQRKRGGRVKMEVTGVEGRFFAERATIIDRSTGRRLRSVP